MAEVLTKAGPGNASAGYAGNVDNGRVATVSDSGRERPSRARQYAGTVLGGLAGAAAAAFSMSRPWVTATATQRGVPALDSSVTGADLHALAGALSFVLLAAFGAVLATRGRVRQGIGVVVIASAAVLVEAAVVPGAADALLREGLAAKGWAGSAPYDVSWQPWRIVTVLGGLLCLAAGWLVVRHGADWPSMGTRYDAPGAEGADDTEGEPTTRAAARDDLASEAAMWQALDEGRDPTQEPQQTPVTMGRAKPERDPDS